MISIVLFDHLMDQFIFYCIDDILYW